MSKKVNAPTTRPNSPQKPPPAVPDAPEPSLPTSPPTSISFPPSLLLLQASAGTFTPYTLSEAIAAFTNKTPESAAELARLAASSDPAERLLALHINLRLVGPTPEILAAAAKDASPLVGAQAAEWLFFNERFDLWHSYLEQVRASWTVEKTDEVAARFTSNPHGKASLPAGLTTLQLGRGLHDFIAALLPLAPDIRSSLRDVILDPASPSQARTSLLQLYQTTRPETYLPLLEALIARRSEDSPARAQALLAFSSVPPARDRLAWLDSKALINPSAEAVPDPLATRLADAQRRLRRNLENDIPALHIQARSQLASTLATAGHFDDLPPAARSNLAAYVERIEVLGPSAADHGLLSSIAALLRSRSESDYASRRLLAQVSYYAQLTRQ
jgi:hypothetical protein